jgi:hypothetical protein
VLAILFEAILFDLVVQGHPVDPQVRTGTHRPSRAKEHFGDHQGFLGGQTERFFFVDARQLCPCIIVFLHTEEIHRVSTARRPVSDLVQIGVEYLRGGGFQCGEFPIADLDLPSFVTWSGTQYSCFHPLDACKHVL